MLRSLVVGRFALNEETVVRIHAEQQMSIILVILVAYLCGSIPFGKIVSSFKGVNILKNGSGNIGFANSLRTMGWVPALIVLAGDIIKGYLPVILTRNNMLVAIAVLLGSIFSPWLKFKGGKGVATTLGISLALSPLIALIGIFVWLIITLVFKKTSLASLITIALLPVLSLFLNKQFFLLYLLILIIVLFTHRRNIKNLINGTEVKTF